MEKALLKKILEKEFYKTNHSNLDREFFPSELGSLYDTIVTAHDKYEVDLKPAWIKKLHKEYNPAITTAAQQNIAILMDDIEHEDDVPDNVAADILALMMKRERARRIANAAVEVMNGKRDDFVDIRNLVDGTEKLEESIQNFEEVEFDLDLFMAKVSPEGMFPFRLPTLRDQLYGAGPGNFIIVFARPEAGKTTYLCYEAAGYLKQGLSVAYFANEEPAFRVYLRLVSSLLEKSVDEIRSDPARAKADFREYAANLSMLDCVGMDITGVDSWASSNTPDVIILDQLDKFSIGGNFSRSDERLGELYTKAREIAKRRKALVYGVSQCSADGEGLATLDFSMLAGSKTAKAAEADIVIGIGRNPQLSGNEDFRQFNISKNKINGWHGSVGVMLDRHKATYNA